MSWVHPPPREQQPDRRKGEIKTGDADQATRLGGAIARHLAGERRGPRIKGEPHRDAAALAQDRRRVIDGNVTLLRDEVNRDRGLRLAELVAGHVAALPAYADAPRAEKQG